MSKRKERKYAHVWAMLKATKYSNQKIEFISLELPKESHASVLGALRKECVLDRAFRAECVLEDKSFEIGFHQIGDLLQIFLKWKPYITESFVIGPERIAKMRKR